MADVLTGITEIDAASLADISSIAQSYLQQASILMPTVTDYSQFAVKGSKSVDLPRSGGFTVLDKAENTSVDAAISAYSVDTISFNLYKVVQFLVEEIADNQSRVAIIQDYLMKASKDMAAQVDNDIITELKLASTATPDHTLVFIDTVTDVMAKGDILAARQLLQAQFINPQECYIGVGPEKESELLNISDFIDASKYGSAEPIQNGEIGKIYGMKTLVHTGFADFACFWHPSAVGLAFQRQLTVQRESDLPNLAERWSLDQRYGVEALDIGTGGSKRSVFIDSTN
jgi:N4-gp56 family major capsid protein